MDEQDVTDSTAQTIRRYKLEGVGAFQKHEDFMAEFAKRKTMTADDLIGAGADQYEAFMRGDWEARHGTEAARAMYGVWRWRGLYEYRHVLIPELIDAHHIIDFGGALGPLGFGAWIVDTGRISIWGENTSLAENLGGDGYYDIVFTSHTLEHVEDYEGTLRMLVDSVKPGGLFIAHVPHVEFQGFDVGAGGAGVGQDAVLAGLQLGELGGEPDVDAYDSADDGDE